MVSIALAILGAFLLGMLVGDVMGDRGRLRRESALWNAAVMDTLRMVDDHGVRRIRPAWQDDPPTEVDIDPWPDGDMPAADEGWWDNC